MHIVFSQKKADRKKKCIQTAEMTQNLQLNCFSGIGTALKAADNLKELDFFGNMNQHKKPTLFHNLLFRDHVLLFVFCFIQKLMQCFK